MTDQTSYSGKELSDMLDLFEVAGKNRADLAERVRMPYNTVKNSILRYRKKNAKELPPSFVENDDKATATSRTVDVKTEDDLMRECKVDLKKWRIDKMSLGKQTVARKGEKKDLYFDGGKISGTIKDDGEMNTQVLYNLKAHLVLREDWRDGLAVENMLTKLKKIAPPRKIRATKIKGDHLLVANLYDVHFNKRAADGRYTIQQAAADYIDVTERVISMSQFIGFSVSEILFGFGNDALHADNLVPTTTRGTKMETESDMREAISVMVDAHITAIEMLAEYRPVTVIGILGNHDYYSTIWLGKLLAVRFANDKRVTVDHGTEERKYFKYGQTLIGMDHGNEPKPEKLLNLMPLEAKKMWSETSHRVFFRGHLHTGKTLVQKLVPTKEEINGTVVRFMSSLSPTDVWHRSKGFVGNKRGGAALFYNRDKGFRGEFPVFVDEPLSSKVG